MRRIIGISLFETQLLRNYVLSDSAEFLKELARNYDIYLFTAPSNENQFKQVIKRFSLTSVSVKVFEAPPFNRKQAFILSLIRWIDPGSSYARTLRMSRKLNNKSSTWMLLRALFRHTFAFIPFGKRLIRGVFKFSTRIYGKDVIKSQELPFIDLLIATSLSDRESDVPLAIIYRNNGTRVIGTVRSWDNLVTKGTLPIEPDLFLSHSPYMTQSSKKFQSFAPSRVMELSTPSYRRRFISNLPVEPNNHQQGILFACVGPGMNPDEYDFVIWLVTLTDKLNLRLSVLQHPKFQHSFEELGSNVNVVTFDYGQTTLIEYYDFLKRHVLVIGGGTSAILDAAFSGTQIALLSFEIQKRDYWLSYLRLYEYQPHLKDFVENCAPLIVNSATELEQLLVGLLRAQPLPDLSSDIFAFTGNLDKDFFEGLLFEIQETLELK